MHHVPCTDVGAGPGCLDCQTHPQVHRIPKSTELLPEEQDHLSSNHSAPSLNIVSAVGTLLAFLALVNVRINVLSDLPHLDDIVLCDTRDDPRVVCIPAEIRDLGGMAAVNKEQLRRTVLGILRTLLLASATLGPRTSVAPGKRVCAPGTWPP